MLTPASAGADIFFLQSRLEDVGIGQTPLLLVDSWFCLDITESNTLRGFWVPTVMEGLDGV